MMHAYADGRSSTAVDRSRPVDRARSLVCSTSIDSGDLGARSSATSAWADVRSPHHEPAPRAANVAASTLKGAPGRRTREEKNADVAKYTGARDVHR